MALAEYGDALNIDTDGSGRPILVDPVSGDTIAVYDRSSGAWEVTTIKAGTGDFNSVNTDTSLTNSSVFWGKSEVTISNGSISYDAPVLNVRGEGKADDNLDNITTSVSDFALVRLRVGGPETITVRHDQGGDGDIKLGVTDRVLDSFRDVLVLQYDPGASEWQEVAFSNNSD